ncbi:hypothetical protein M885DRAFT_529628 [Pelagophyceae sp. CCMP2097]|nr:hypothetical protein M885DRAFT_529628 [Pelagophyceae sp. CCMP2097]
MVRPPFLMVRAPLVWQRPCQTQRRHGNLASRHSPRRRCRTHLVTRSQAPRPFHFAEGFFSRCDLDGTWPQGPCRPWTQRGTRVVGIGVLEEGPCQRTLFKGPRQRDLVVRTVIRDGARRRHLGSFTGPFSKRALVAGFQKDISGPVEKVQKPP